MDEGEHFCSICGGPLYTNFVQHTTYDPSLATERDIEWLKLTRIVRANTHDDADPNEGAYYISMMGTYEYEPFRVFRTNLNGPTNELEFNAWEDGFVVHNACFMMLHEIGMSDKHMITMGREMFLRMQMRLCMSGDTVINWGDNSHYGGSGIFQGHRWMGRAGYEWLVANPDYEPDFSDLLEEAKRDSPDEIDADLWDEAKHYENGDPFWCLPVEIRHVILHLLPPESLFDILRASPAFCVSSTSLLNRYWYLVIEDKMPWMEHTALSKTLTEIEDPIDYKTLAARLVEVTITLDGMNGPLHEYLGLQNRRRIMSCIDLILDDLEDTVGGKDNHDGVLPEILNMSSFRGVTISRDESIDRENTDVYIRPVILNPPSPQGVQVYFGEGGCMVGMEFLLEGDICGRLVGHEAKSVEGVSFPKDTVINGFIISLGPRLEFQANDMIRGIAIIADGDYRRPYARFGHWTNNDVVQILCTRPMETLVGFSAQYTEFCISQFGIIVAELATSALGFVWDSDANLLAATRWVKEWPSPNYEPAKLLPSLKQLNIDYQAPVHFLDFESRIIDSIKAFFPHGAGKAIGGLLFTFSDRIQKLVGVADNHGSISQFACNEITFNPGNEQRITGVAINCTDSRLGSPLPCGVGSLVFITEPRSNNMILGCRRGPGNYVRLKGPYEYYEKERRVVGMQFVFEYGVITQVGLVH
ncbi:hypothetical protein BDV26DRAFT_169252 [Aspergillus bertholletiae]|uniref:F-box domain-containing protein n=1 Tax=Aspergillus bertholletiae TaxID=1226010 RepID=A0A5N7BC38_9EURO|nr:hypothetical protein BDV26DRAFT_169252 [Aspergillus bertholletiae]